MFGIVLGYFRGETGFRGPFARVTEVNYKLRVAKAVFSKFQELNVTN